MADIFSMSLSDRLYRTRYEPDSDHSHIRVDNTLCGSCADKPCVALCPAHVYTRDPNDEARIIVSHDNCLECGTCVQVCPTDSLAWDFPDGGMGVKYRFG
jgi:ferredoxin like protein